MKRHDWKKCLLAILAGILFCQVTVFADVDVMNISQVVQRGNDVYVYVNALEENGKPTSDMLAAEQFSVNLANNSLPVQEASVYQSTNQGISYIFGIDISKSLTAQEMEEIKSSISAFINGMSGNDYARIITIGSEITSLCDSTQDRNALQTAVTNINRDANYTYLYKGISYALEGQRKRVETIPERAVLILFTDGMDDSDGAYGSAQILTDLKETRIPIYVVGVKGQDKSAALSSVAEIAQYSGGNIISYNDMSITEAVQTIGEIMRNTVQLHLHPEYSVFKTGGGSWKVKYNSGSYSVESRGYDYKLGMAGVTAPTPTAAPTATPTPKPTAVPTPTPMIVPERTPVEKIMDFVTENMILCIAVLCVVIALIIILISVLKRKKRNNVIEAEPLEEHHELPESNYEYNNMMDDADEDRTIDELYESFESFDDDMTIAPDDSGLRVAFEISFGGMSDTVECKIREQLILGRGNECDVDVVLNSTREDRKQTSRKHAYLMNRPDGLYIKDNSKNKTYLNGMEISGEVALQNEDILQLGKATVKVKILSC